MAADRHSVDEYLETIYFLATPIGEYRPVVTGTPTLASSTTTAGAITATFTAPSGTAPASYTATACTNAGMTTGCVTQAGYTSGAQLTGLTQGTAYYVQITANGPAMFAFYRDVLGLPHEGDMKMPFGGTMHRMRCGTTTIKIVAAEASVAGSRGSRPNSSVSTKRDSHRLTAAPTANTLEMPTASSPTVATAPAASPP